MRKEYEDHLAYFQRRRKTLIELRNKFIDSIFYRWLKQTYNFRRIERLVDIIDAKSWYYDHVHRILSEFDDEKEPYWFCYGCNKLFKKDDRHPTWTHDYLSCIAEHPYMKQCLEHPYMKMRENFRPLTKKEKK